MASTLSSKSLLRHRPPQDAVARVWMKPGTGKIAINSRALDNYFGRATSKMVLRQPLELTETMGRYDIFVNVSRRRSLRPGGCHPPRHHPRADEDQRRVPPGAQEGRLRHPRCAQERAQEVRSAWRSRPLPVLEALTAQRRPLLNAGLCDGAFGRLGRPYRRPSRPHAGRPARHPGPPAPTPAFRPPPRPSVPPVGPPAEGLTFLAHATHVTRGTAPRGLAWCSVSARPARRLPFRNWMQPTRRKKLASGRSAGQ